MQRTVGSVDDFMHTSTIRFLDHVNLADSVTYLSVKVTGSTHTKSLLLGKVPSRGLRVRITLPMRCPKCTAEIPAESRYCNSCGAGVAPRRISFAEEKGEGTRFRTDRQWWYGQSIGMSGRGGLNLGPKMQLQGV